MMKASNISTLPDNPEHERLLRMRKYTIMMSIRFVCLFMLVLTDGIWVYLFALGAIFLPYLAVVIANSVNQRRLQPESPVLPLPAPSSNGYDKNDESAVE